ncbi:Ubiquitin-associated protein like [Actinidia chinensis var. chinensis]|uniref:Ubiquitin-associated protein like n=1 Tax=Actinidia chinensis var. chinensis TaxID=1590841 RepID=A0A2R6QHH7_ACTCC|nr:Ubiquitin-associated protein like [Actinidia chinensis var. chinensis]
MRNHYLRLRDPSQPQMRLVTSSQGKDLFLDEFVWVLGSWEFQLGDDGLWSFPRHNGSLPDRFKYKFKFCSDTCKEAIRASNNKKESRYIEAPLKGRAPQREAFNPEVFGCEEDYATSSLGHSSPDRIDNQEEEEASGQLVLNRRRSRVVPTTDLEGMSFLVPVLSSDNEDDLVRTLRLSIHGTKVVRTSSSEAGIIRFRNLNRAASTAIPPKAVLPTLRAPTNSCVVDRGGYDGNGVDPGSLGASAPRKYKGKEPSVGTPKRPQRETSLSGTTELWKPNFSAYELGRQVMDTDFARDLATSLALVQAIMLTNDSTEPSKGDGNLRPNGRVFNRAKAGQKEDGGQCKQGKTCAVRGQPAKGRPIPRGASPRCQLCIYSPSLREGYYYRGCSRRTLVGSMWPYDAPAPEFPESPAPYSPLILSSFDEEEFLNKLEEDEVVPKPIRDLTAAPDIEAIDLVEEVRRMVAKALGEWSTEETRAADGRDADQNSLL